MFCALQFDNIKGLSKIGKALGMRKLGYVKRFAVSGLAGLGTYFGLAFLGMRYLLNRAVPQKQPKAPQQRIPEGYREAPLLRRGQFAQFQRSFHVHA